MSVWGWGVLLFLYMILVFLVNDFRISANVNLSVRLQGKILNQQYALCVCVGWLIGWFL